MDFEAAYSEPRSDCSGCRAGGTENAKKSKNFLQMTMFTEFHNISKRKWWLPESKLTETITLLLCQWSLILRCQIMKKKTIVINTAYELKAASNLHLFHQLKHLLRWKAGYCPWNGFRSFLCLNWFTKWTLENDNHTTNINVLKSKKHFTLALQECNKSEWKTREDNR